MDDHKITKGYSLLRMALICGLPLVILIFAGDKIFSQGSAGLIFIVFFIIVHAVMMSIGHGSRHNQPNE